MTYLDHLVVSAVPPRILVDKVSVLQKWQKLFNIEHYCGLIVFLGSDIKISSTLFPLSLPSWLQIQ